MNGSQDQLQNTSKKFYTLHLSANVKSLYNEWVMETLQTQWDSVLRQGKRTTSSNDTNKSLALAKSAAQHCPYTVTWWTKSRITEGCSYCAFFMLLNNYMQNKVTEDQWEEVTLQYCHLFTLCFADPHIKVSGKRDDVKEAKEKIMSVLDTKVSYITRAVWVSFNCT